MAYKKVFKRKSVRRRYRKRGGGWMTTARRAMPYVLSSLKFLKSVVNVEKKFIDSGVVSNNVGNAGAIYYLSGVAQGTDQITRNGNSIKASYIC